MKARPLTKTPNKCNEYQYKFYNACQSQPTTPSKHPLLGLMGSIENYTYHHARDMDSKAEFCAILKLAAWIAFLAIWAQKQQSASVAGKDVIATAVKVPKLLQLQQLQQPTQPT
eukprot:600596-Ditylum_brightwellii.AAC.1